LAHEIGPWIVLGGGGQYAMDRQWIGKSAGRFPRSAPSWGPKYSWRFYTSETVPRTGPKPKLFANH
jgi:hypothetical protein